MSETTGSEPLYPCPCCGWLVFREPPGSYEICRVCGWEDDLAQLRFPTMSGGANSASLVAAQEARSDARAPGPDDLQRDPRWRPVDPTIDVIEDPPADSDLGASYVRDRTWYYYWRRP
jgi:hypothetical protein